jgi:hypothetical protein
MLPPDIQTRMDQPTYHCPKCREPTSYPPVQIYPLKDVVRELGKTMHVNADDGSEQQRAGLFDDFFPSREDLKAVDALFFARLLQS